MALVPVVFQDVPLDDLIFDITNIHNSQLSPNSFCVLFWESGKKDFGVSKAFSVSLAPFCCCIRWDCVRVREVVSKSLRRGNKDSFFVVPQLDGLVFLLFVCF